MSSNDCFTHRTKFSYNKRWNSPASYNGAWKKIQSFCSHDLTPVPIDCTAINHCAFFEQSRLLFMADQSGQTSVAFRTEQRVHAAGDPRRTGTIRYIGPVSGHDGEWIGVDWDDDSGGKHDGTVNGTRYFSARTSSSGSFVRSKGLSAGISLLDAIYRRYRGESTKEEEGTSVKMNQRTYLEYF